MKQFMHMNINVSSFKKVEEAFEDSVRSAQSSLMGELDYCKLRDSSAKAEGKKFLTINIDVLSQLHVIILKKKLT